MELKDSGARRHFDTGAVRDIAEGKGRCDLLPLDVIAEQLNSNTLRHIAAYVRNGDPREIYEAIARFVVENQASWGQNMITAYLEVSKQYEDGAKKYDDRNWEKGIDLHCFIDSGVRHYLKYMRGDTDEPHDRAFMWNMLGALWTQQHHCRLVDLPFAAKEESA